MTDRVQDIWPESNVKIDLPGKIEDVVAISDIAFRSSKNLPEVSLTLHGTGAQSTILYQTHYLLDSDKSLHQGMYYPVWLVEEPESFLHADIAFKLGRLLASTEWQSSIQMLISTHSPIILAGSRQNPDTNKWVLLEKHSVTFEREVSNVENNDIEFIGRVMGDANFDVYFTGASGGPLIFIEDSKKQTCESFREADIAVTKGLDGITEVKKFLNVYLSVSEAVVGDAYFIVDGDEGLKLIKSMLSDGEIVLDDTGWKKYRLSDKLFVIVLPDGSAVEDLFEEWDDVLEGILDDILDDSLSIKEKIPARLSQIVVSLRSSPPSDREEAKNKIRNIKDAKDRFWEQLKIHKWKMSKSYVSILSNMLSEQ